MDLCVKHYLNDLGMEPVAWSKSAWQWSASAPEDGWFWSHPGAKHPQKEELLMALCPALCLPTFTLQTHVGRKQAHLEVRKIPCVSFQGPLIPAPLFQDWPQQETCPYTCADSGRAVSQQHGGGLAALGVKGSSEMILSPCSTGRCQLTLKGTSYLPQSWPSSCSTQPATCVTGLEPFLTLSSFIYLN